MQAMEYQLQQANLSVPGLNAPAMPSPAATAAAASPAPAPTAVALPPPPALVRFLHLLASRSPQLSISISALP